MQLKELVSTALIDIAEGVLDAMPTYSKYSCAVNPCHIQKDTTSGLYFKKPGGQPDDYFSVTNVEFEIGLTDNSGVEGRAGLGVFFGNVGLGGSTKEQANTTSVTKIKFSVPVKLPTQSL